MTSLFHFYGITLCNTAGWYSHFLKFPVHKIKNTYHKKNLRPPFESARRVLARWTSFGEKILKLKKKIFLIFCAPTWVRYSTVLAKKKLVVVQNTWKDTFYNKN